jgi:hypothetical protein
VVGMKYDGRFLVTEILEYKKEIWQNNQFCRCGANNLKKCECSSQKKKSFLRRRKKKVNEKFSKELDKGLQYIVESDEQIL